MLGHAEAGDHVPGDLRGLVDVIRGTRGDLVEHQSFSSAPAEQHGHLVFQFLAGHQEAVLGGTLQGIAEGADAARDDGNLVHRVHAGQCGRNQRMAHFVAGDHLALVGIEQPALFFEPGDDALNGCREIGHGDRVGGAAGGEQRRLIDQVGQIGAGKTRCQGSNLICIDIRAEIDFLQMHLENRDPTDPVGSVDQHLPVEAPGAEQGRVENLRPVGGCEQHDPGAGIKAVQFREQLIERLLLLVMAARERADAARASQRIQLVDEDDAGRGRARLLEQVAYPGGAHADEHLHKLRPADREERHARLTCHCAREQRLPGAGRSDQQYALRDVGAQASIVLRLLEKGDNLLELLFRLIDAGNIIEGDLGVRLHVDLGLALADAHQAAEALTLGNSTDEEAPDRKEKQDRQYPGEYVAQKRAFDLGGVLHSVFVQQLGKLRIHARGDEKIALVGQGRLEFASYVVLLDDDLLDLVLLEEVFKFAVGYGFDLLAGCPPVSDEQDGSKGK